MATGIVAESESETNTQPISNYASLDKSGCRETHRTSRKFRTQYRLFERL